MIADRTVCWQSETTGYQEHSLHTFFAPALSIVFLWTRSFFRAIFSYGGCSYSYELGAKSHVYWIFGAGSPILTAPTGTAGLKWLQQHSVGLGSHGSPLGVKEHYTVKSPMGLLGFGPAVLLCGSGGGIGLGGRLCHCLHSSSSFPYLSPPQEASPSPGGNIYHRLHQW